MANKPGEANFFPDVPQFPSMGTFQPVYGKFDLTTYIQGASDYEIMTFLVGKYNACLEAYGNITKLSTDTITACKQLQDWINSWFTNLDVQQELNNKIDSMVQDGSFSTLLHQTFDAQINQQTTNAVTAWLVANVTPTGSAVVVDKSLSIEGAAADAKATGELKEYLVAYKFADKRDTNQNFLPTSYTKNAGFYEDGNLNTNIDGSCVSDYFVVNENDIITGFSGHAVYDRIVFYNSNKEIVSTVQFEPSKAGVIAPANAYYARVQTRLSEYAVSYIAINPSKFYLGNAKELRTVLDRIGDGSEVHYTIYISNGTYDIASTFTDDDINNADYIGGGWVGLVVGNNVSIIGENPKSTILTCSLPTTYSANKRAQISTLNLKGNCTLKNITVTMENIRYPIHDDFPQNANCTHTLINCNFYAGLNPDGQKTSGYGLGTNSGQLVVMDNCISSPLMIYHNNVGFTAPSTVIMNNCEVPDTLNLWDFNCEVKCHLQLNSCKIQVLAHGYNGVHAPTIMAYGRGCDPLFVKGDANFIYIGQNTKKVKIHYGAKAGSVVTHFSGLDGQYTFDVMTPSNKNCDGILLEDVEPDGYGYIQLNGNVSSSMLGETNTSSWSIGDLLKPNDSTYLLEKTTDSALAVARVLFVIDNVVYIKLLD